MHTITLYWDCASQACWQAFQALPTVLQAMTLPQGYRVRYWPVCLPDTVPALQRHAERVAQAQYWLLAHSLSLPDGLPNRYGCDVAMRWVWQADDAQPPLALLPTLAVQPDTAAVQAHRARLAQQALQAGVRQLPCWRVGENPALVLSLEELANSLM